MNNEKNSADDYLTKRFRRLNVCTTVILLLAIFISIYQFGGEDWHGQKQVALIIPGSRDQLGWNKTQYLAMKNVSDLYDYNLILRENVPSDYNTCAEIVAELSKMGVNNICFMNGLHLYDLRDFEKKYQTITFCTVESVSVMWGTGSYAILAFEGSYMAGIVAGLQTKTNKIGYIAPFSDPEINLGINAFTMGVQRVNPDAEVLLSWTGGWSNPSSEEQAVQNLKANKVDVLTYHQNGETVATTAQRAGIQFIAYNENYPQNKYCLGAIKIDWQKVYGDMLRYYKTSEKNSDYSFGVAEHMVDLEVTDIISTRAKILVDTAKWELQNGRIIFTGDIFDRNGVRRCSANEAMSLRDLQKKMDWLIKGVKTVGT